VVDVTITLDEQTAQWALNEAARHDVTVSRWIGQLLEERRRDALDYQRAQHGFLQRHGAALQQPGARPPSRDDLHDR
jgi:hypothetical protein